MKYLVSENLEQNNITGLVISTTSTNALTDNPALHEVAQTLFEGVSSIRNIKYSSSLIPLTSNTRAVLSNEDGTKFLIVAATYGQGRCVFFGHQNYMPNFDPASPQTHPEETLDPKFIENVKRWVSGGKWTATININEQDTWANIDTKEKILVWRGTWDKTTDFINSLVSEVALPHAQISY